MALESTANGHIVIGPDGRARIDDTSFRVDQLVVEHLAYGWTAEELYVQHARTLTPAQIYSALAYYYDHQTEIDQQIRQDRAYIEEMRRQAGPSPFAQRMRREGRLP